MQIKTFGATAEITVTREQVVETMLMIQKVRRAKGETDFICPYFYAKAITTEVKTSAREDRIGAKAARMSAAGRFRRAKLAIA